MIAGVTGSKAADSDHTRRAASVAAVSDIGPRKANEDRSLAALSGDDGSWVIAVADGLGGHARGDEAAQAAVQGLPRRIASPVEMAAAFEAADERVLALTGPDTWQRRLPLFMFPMSTLCVAAWTPEGGLLIGWMGDTVPFVASAGSGGFGGYCCGRPHRNFDGSISVCLGMPADAQDRVEGQMDVEILDGFDDAALPDAVILASDGAWEPFVYARGVEWLWDDSVAGGIGSVCASDARTAEDLAGGVLSSAKKLGLNDNATVAAALWH